MLSLFVLKKYKANKIVTFISLGILSVSPIILIYPELILGVYYNYPPQLKLFWLSHVTEAKSAIDNIQSDGFLSPKNNLLSLIPAFLSILYIRKKTALISLYMLFVLLSLPFIFWQIRTITITLLVAVPLQAFFAIQVCEKLKPNLLKIMITLLVAPISISILLIPVNNYFSNGQAEPPPKLHPADIISVLNRHHVTNSKILAPIDYGAEIIALTNNRVISAPYHRNIKGNQLAVDIYTATDLNNAYRKLEINHINYIMFGTHTTSQVYSRYSDKSSLINQLYNGQYLSWLTLVEHDDKGFFLFKVKTQ